MLDAGTLAHVLGVSPEWVDEHADELGQRTSDGRFNVVAAHRFLRETIAADADFSARVAMGRLQLPEGPPSRADVEAGLRIRTPGSEGGNSDAA